VPIHVRHAERPSGCVKEEGTVTCCPECGSMYQTIVVGPRTWGTCNDCGVRWVREGTAIQVVYGPKQVPSAGAVGERTIRSSSAEPAGAA
jgi:hypothetical protein